MDSAGVKSRASGLYESEIDDAQPVVVHEQEIPRMKVYIKKPARIQHPIPGSHDFSCRFIAFILRWISSQKLFKVNLSEAADCLANP
jgi:hypothetical protein